MADDVTLTQLGWLEWAALPDLGIPLLHAKVDTGAKTSSLHAEELRIVEVDGAHLARFVVRTSREVYQCQCPVYDERQVKSSSGHETLRVVIRTKCLMHGVRWPIELTLADRTSMRYPMLLGRRAMEGRFIVDPAKKHLGGKPKRRRKP